jgi:hypothetical protein
MLREHPLEGLEAAHYLDGLEERVMEVGWALMRPLIVEQWRLTDQALENRGQTGLRPGKAALSSG